MDAHVYGKTEHKVRPAGLAAHKVVLPTQLHLEIRQHGLELGAGVHAVDGAGQHAHQRPQDEGRLQHGDVQEELHRLDGAHGRAREGGQRRVADPVVAGAAVALEFPRRVVRRDEVGGDGGRLGDDAAVLRHQLRRFAQRVGFRELWRRAALSRAGLGAVVQFEVVADFELLEQPKDALGLGVLWSAI